MAAARDGAAALAKYPLSNGWLSTTGALASELGARLILGVNLAANSRAIAGAASGIVGSAGRIDTKSST